MASFPIFYIVATVSHPERPCMGGRKLSIIEAWSQTFPPSMPWSRMGCGLQGNKNYQKISSDSVFNIFT